MLGARHTGQAHRLSTTSTARSQRTKSGSSHRWLRRQRDDVYAQQARTDGYRTRSAYKLVALNEKHRFLRPGGRCIDCGSNPGGWSQVAAELVLSGGTDKAQPDAMHAREGLVVAVDLLPMPPLAGVHFVQGDFRSDDVQRDVVRLLDGLPADVVLSDMAPSLSGIRMADQARSMELCETALYFAQQYLKEGGTFVCKIFMDGGDPSFQQQLRSLFRKVHIEKPMASRKDSAESYLVCLDKQ
ncbi:ribosomal RNA large subunit methyltransferase j [Syncephalis pseudoplumigaleata]|uniref:rRNA methyltransferase 2, mitochondrial n=1 Tax=Syncephalis pseudoplumigaleata TaxID=1712513 RepID=A0A4P9Z0Y4_9FUNG|nr:ribosomal RNA large subunit methyltransferase j [Syncephalis pseudoplumigaleata]|eukprot:RKP26117.1 ribosomal RNA large subunit methyltransferase j [Syncephalis pseudoplumigaleata]